MEAVDGCFWLLVAAVSGRLLLVARDLHRFWQLIAAASRWRQRLFLAFSEVLADILILETGMGGRLDATNVIPVSSWLWLLARVCTIQLPQKVFRHWVSFTLCRGL